MPRLPTRELGNYVFLGSFSTRGCILARCSRPPVRSGSFLPGRSLPRLTFPLHTLRDPEKAAAASDTARSPLPIPLRKELKDKAKALKAYNAANPNANVKAETVPGWELTVGIEIHAQLNADRKLFSDARNEFSTAPNSNVAFFDLAMPGSQPVFQPEALIPAIRAALALDCDIQRVSRFDRKHYFHWDQPAGYQITQYYEPFAKDGHINLYARDGIAPEDGQEMRVDIKQIQMEQDTAKTIAHPDGSYWLDFNRAGAPLIEIITMPQIHYPSTAAAFVRKVQSLLNAVDACVSTMETGGLRADVNVSVRPEGGPGPPGPLGTRVEIKNLSSFKAVRDAIISERDRLISERKAGRDVLSETRGFDGKSSVLLRGKEGAVVYRYMPDPDIGPVVIGSDLVSHLRDTMGTLPDTEAELLVRDYDMSAKDAGALMQMDGGGRAEFFYQVIDAVEQRLQKEGNRKPEDSHRKLAGQWVLHELGRVTSERNTDIDDSQQQLGMTAGGACRIPVGDLADILFYLHQGMITAHVAKELLFAVFRGDLSDPNLSYNNVTDAIEQSNLWFHELPEEEYRELARLVIQDAKELDAFMNFKRYPEGKLHFFYGQMRRLGSPERMLPATGMRILREEIDAAVKRRLEDTVLI